MSGLLPGSVEAAFRYLALDRIHVWTVPVGADPAGPERCFALLDGDERERAGRFRRRVDCERYVVAHGVLRFLLGRYAGRDPRTLRFGAGAYGKPHLLDPGAATLHFNLSHSGGLVLVAVARDRRVGIDVEEWGAFDYDDVATLAFSDAERRQLSYLPEADKAAGFFAGWTRKEAYIKATGLGVSDGLKHFDVALSPDVPARLLVDRRARRIEAWTMIELPVPFGYSAALVGEGAGWEATPLRFAPALWELLP